MAEMNYFMSDLYPGIGLETSTQANPEKDDQEALIEDTDVAEESSQQARSKNVFLALGLMIALIVFFGGGK